MKSELILLISCCATRAGFFMRSSPPSVTKAAAKLNDKQLIRAFAKIFTLQLDDEQKQRVRMPFRCGGF